MAQNAKLWAEPGRGLVAEAGSTVARVELRKDDALYLNDGAFGTLFDATHLNWAFPAKLLREEQAAPSWRLSASMGRPAIRWTRRPGRSCCRRTCAKAIKVEIGPLGAYGTAMPTRINGFGDAATIEGQGPRGHLCTGKRPLPFGHELQVRADVSELAP